MKTSNSVPNAPARLAPAVACLFCSGFCALIYQTTWLREFRLIFGASTAASAFMPNSIVAKRTWISDCS